MQWKKHPLEFQKVDGSAFFTNVDQHRVFARARGLCRLAETKGWSFVIVPRTKGDRCRFSTRPARSNRHCTSVPISELLDAVAFLEGDRFFTLGSLVIEQLKGVAMGHVLSPILTTLDLEISWNEFWSGAHCEQNLAELGLSAFRGQWQSLVFSILHVDDGIFCSKALCGNCLRLLATRCWPSDVELEFEGSIESTRFLHSEIRALHCRGGCKEWLDIQPWFVNKQFAQGLAVFPSVGRLATWYSSAQPFRQLRDFIWCSLALSDDIFGSASSGWHFYLSLVIGEALYSLWPAQYLAKCFRTYPRYHRSMFASSVRRIGKVLEKCKNDISDTQAALVCSDGGNRPELFTLISSVVASCPQYSANID